MDLSKLIESMDKEKLAALSKTFGMDLTDEQIEAFRNKVKDTSNEELMSQLKGLKENQNAKDDLLSKVSNNEELKKKLDNFLNKK